LRIGTRGSDLALVQARSIADALKKREPGLDVKIVPIRTRADRMQNVAIVELGGKGVFVKEIETELIAGGIDIAVHSMKDVPVELPEGLEIVAYPKREDPRDVLISRGNVKIEELPRKAKIGTGALRRRMQLLNVMRDLEMVPIRGNVQTRIRKIESEGLDGIILAAAGIRRMGLQGQVSQFISTDFMLPAAGQGVLGIEIRSGERELKERLRFLNDPDTVTEITAERAFLRKLGGGCRVPIAGYAQLHGNVLQVRGMVGTADGKRLLQETLRGPREDAESIGEAVAESILAKGGLEILAATEDYG